MRAHFKGLRCEICSQAFCIQSALEAHQDQGCEASIEPPEAVEIKFTAVDSEPGVSSRKCDDEEEEETTMFDCETVLKEIGTSEDEETENETIQLESRSSNLRIKASGRKPQKRIRRSRKILTRNRDDVADRMYHCYLCEKR